MVERAKVNEQIKTAVPRLSARLPRAALYLGAYWPDAR